MALGSAAWIWGLQSGFGVSRVDWGSSIVLGFQCAFGAPACSQGFQLNCVEAGGLSTQEVLRGSLAACGEVTTPPVLSLTAV